ncbi:hypothetical protein MMC30_006961 [Trapelia coarctata]|nr:hypothetical protein [Trapelia coarctata]
METSPMAHRNSKAAARAPPIDGGTSSGPPTMGVLTRTVFRSPVTKLILPARIRHRHKNDVVFVQETSIEIKEYIHGNLEHIAVKDDFGATIRSAGVIREPRKRIMKVEPDTEADDESARDAILRQSSATKQPTPGSMDIDDTHPLHGMPPQILVMALQSGPEDSLLFLSASHDEPDALRFRSYQIPLPAKKEQSKRLGKHIAIDPRSRAMAVSASSGSFVVYTLKPMSELWEEVKSSEGLREESFHPVIEERHVQINGIIQKMEFLYPSTEDQDHVILLLVVTSGDKTRVQICEWDNSRDLREIGAPKSHPLPTALRCPLLLIPFTIVTGFILVCEGSICVFLDILTGEPRLSYVRTPQDMHQTGAREPGSSRRFPLWTAWARPLRRDNYASENDVFYLCREDGTVQFLEFRLDSIPQNAFHRPGELLVNVDTAFAALDLAWDRFQPRTPTKDDQWEGGDILIVAGDMSDGKVVRMAARRNAESTQSIPNWTPMVDFCTINSFSGGTFAQETHRPETRPLLDGRERIFGCVGRGRNHGAVCEMRLGIEACSRIYSEVGDQIAGLWILPDISGTNSGVCLLTTWLDDTAMLLQIPNGPSSEILELEDLFGIQTDSKTFAAGTTSTGHIVQVTAHSLRVFEPGHSVSVVRPFENERVILACIWSEAILIATERNGDLCLRYVELKVLSGQVSLGRASGPILMQAEPSCLSIQLIEGVKYAFIGDNTGKLHVFVASSTDGLTRKLTFDFDEEFAICDSVTLLRQESQVGSGDHYVLLCGLRNGSLQTFLFDPHLPGSVNMSHCETLMFGKTKVSVIADNTSWDPSRSLCSRAIVLCGKNFCRLTFRLSADRSCNALIQSIWLTAANDTEIYQSALSAVAQSDPWSVDHEDESRLLFCIQDGHFYGTELGLSLRPHTVVRHMRVPGTPNRIMFSNHLQKLVVACTTIKVRPGPITNGQMRDSNKRLLYPTLMFLDPDDSTIESALDMKPELHDENAREGQMLPGRTPRIIGRSGMRVLGLLEWKAKLEGRSFLLLAINSMRPRNEGNRITGIINLYTITKDPTDQIALKSSGSIKCEQRVYSLAQYDESSLVYTSGTALHLTTLENADGTSKLTHRMSWDRLRSEGVSVSVRKPYIYVTTAKHSISVFVIERNAFRPLFTDEDGARPGLHHIVLPTHPMVLASDRNGVVAGLWQPPFGQAINSFRTVFEAVLPGPIRKLHLALVKTPWSAEREEVEDTIIGSSLDGSFYQFELLDEAKWRLLRFLQNLCERNGNICPLKHLKRHRQRLEPLVPTKRDMHIDGDILWRLIERGGRYSGMMIQSMLEEAPDEDPSRRTDEFETSEERVARFSEIVRDAALGGDSGENDSVEAVVRFLRSMLQPIL